MNVENDIETNQPIEIDAIEIHCWLSFNQAMLASLVIANVNTKHWAEMG